MLLTRVSTTLAAAGLALLCAMTAAQTCPLVTVSVNAPTVVKRGGRLLYKATVKNAGASTVNSFELNVNTPALTTVQKAPGRKGATTSIGDGPFGVRIMVPSLPSGKQVTLSLRLTVDKCAPEVLTIGALAGRNFPYKSNECATTVPDAVIQVKGDNTCDNATPRLPSGFTSYAEIAALYNAPQGESVPSYMESGIECQGKYALCAFAACRIVSTDTSPPLAECGCYGYTSPPPGNDSISLLSQNLLLSMQAQSQNSGCLTQPQSCANPPPTAPVCNDLNQSPPTIYESKFDIISTFNPYTWPTSTSSSVLPTNSFCTRGQFANCCTSGCFNQRSWNGFNTTCYCPVYNTVPSDNKVFYVGEGTCEGSKGFNVGSITYSGMYFV